MKTKRFILCLILPLIVIVCPARPLLAESIKVDEFAEETATVVAIRKVLPAVVSITLKKLWWARALVSLFPVMDLF